MLHLIACIICKLLILTNTVQ